MLTVIVDLGYLALQTLSGTSNPCLLYSHGQDCSAAMHCNSLGQPCSSKQLLDSIPPPALHSKSCLGTLNPFILIRYILTNATSSSSTFIQQSTFLPVFSIPYSSSSPRRTLQNYSKTPHYKAQQLLHTRNQRRPCLTSIQHFWHNCCPAQLYNRNAPLYDEGQPIVHYLNCRPKQRASQLVASHNFVRSKITSRKVSKTPEMISSLR